MEDISLHILDIVENSITAKAKNVKIKLVKKTNWLTVEIEDDGIGMSKEMIKNCLDPFWTTKNKKTGLGIPLLYQSAKESGGDLEIKSRRGKGTKILATFNLSNVDCKPLGNIKETLKVLEAGNPKINFNYEEKGLSSRKNSLRLKNYDYYLQGPYFITICTHKRAKLFENSSICNCVIEIIKTVGADLSARIHCVAIDEDHLHGLIRLSEDRNVPLYKFIAVIKVRITQFLKQGRVNPPLRIWQRGFYDHVIRNETDFLEKAKYIQNHPIKEDGNMFTEWH